MVYHSYSYMVYHIGMYMVYAIQICVTFLFLFDPQYSENGRMSPKRPNGTGAAAKTPAGPTETADQATSGTKKNTRAFCRPLATATLAHIPYVIVYCIHK